MKKRAAVTEPPPTPEGEDGSVPLAGRSSPAAKNNVRGLLVGRRPSSHTGSRVHLVNFAPSHSVSVVPSALTLSLAELASCSAVTVAGGAMTRVGRLARCLPRPGEELEPEVSERSLCRSVYTRQHARSRQQRDGATSSRTPAPPPEQVFRLVGSVKHFDVEGVCLHKSRRIDDIDRSYRSPTGDGMIRWKDQKRDRRGPWRWVVQVRCHSRAARIPPDAYQCRSYSGRR